MEKLHDFFEYGGLKMREASQGDVATLAPIINKAYSYQDEAKGAPRIDHEKLSSRMKEVDFYVVVSDDQILGCVYIELSEEILKFGLLTVAEAWQKRGVGRAILHSIIRMAKSLGFISIHLDYMSLAPWLSEYYREFGFRETGAVEPWGAIDLVQMELKL